MLKGIPKQKWMKLKLKDVMITKIVSLKENENAFNVLNKISKLGLGVMPVIKNKKLIGAVNASLLMRKV